MISLDDPRWASLTGGYGIPFDPRPLLERLEIESDTANVWQEIWNELHHQGDVGGASFAAVPFLVRSYCKRGGPDWNTYAIVAIIELARNQAPNPDVPDWIAGDYFRAIRELAEFGGAELFEAQPKTISAPYSALSQSREGYEFTESFW
jgi:hypothetical protein